MSLTDDKSERSHDISAVLSQLQTLLSTGQNEEVLHIVTAFLDGYSRLRDQNTALEQRLAQMLRKSVSRRSEKVSPDQMSFLLSKLEEIPETLKVEPKALPSGLAAKTGSPPSKGKKKGHGRRPLPQNLPREVCVHEVSVEDIECAVCGALKTCIGVDTRQELEFVPAHFKIVEYQRKKYACKQCEEDITRAPRKEQVIDGSYAGASLLTHVLISKYVDHLPLHRIQQIYRRSNVDIPTSTLSDWVLALAKELTPISQMIQLQVLTSHLVQVDDTGLRVLEKGKGKGLGVKKGHLWAYVGDGEYVAFIYTPTREGKGPQDFLAHYQGWLQADAYAGYDALFDLKRGGKAVEVGCFAHARRYYVDLLDTDARAAIPVAYIRDLYAIEREATEQKLDADARLLLRKDRAPPILKHLGKWVADIMNKEPPKSALYLAAQYTLNQWKALNRFLEDGRLPLDNTGCERALRVVAQGRKAYLFAGSDSGAEAAACMYTIFGTCALADVDPWTYIRDVLTKLSLNWPNKRAMELLPPIWAKQHAEQARTE